jgi:3-oxoadipate CoA-transferase alpha subunit
VPTMGKIRTSALEALGDVADGSTVLVGGWGGIGVPQVLITELASRKPQNLVVVSNNCGMGQQGDVGILFEVGAVSKVISTFPSNPAATQFRERYHAGEVALELSPQGTLAERLRSGGAGLGGFFTPTGAGTLLAEGKETRMINNVPQIFEEAIFADIALIRAHQADERGNLRFRYAARNFAPLMAMAAKRTIVEVDTIVPVGHFGPDDVHLPGVFVDAILETGAAGV